MDEKAAIVGGSVLKKEELKELLCKEYYPDLFNGVDPSGDYFNVLSGLFERLSDTYKALIDDPEKFFQGVSIGRDDNLKAQWKTFRGREDIPAFLAFLAKPYETYRDDSSHSFRTYAEYIRERIDGITRSRARNNKPAIPESLMLDIALNDNPSALKLQEITARIRGKVNLIASGHLTQSDLDEIKALSDQCLDLIYPDK